MTVSVGTGDLRRALRVHTGRAMIAAARHLSRAGARLVGHPSGEKRALQVVREAPSRAFVYRSPGNDDSSLEVWS